MVCLSSALSFGSTINSLTTSAGFTYTGTVGSSNVSFNDLLNTLITVTFSDNSSFACSFSSLGAQDVGCTVASKFGFDGTPKNSQTNSATWTISNLNSLAITSVSINIITPGAGFDTGTSPGPGTVKGVSAGDVISANALLTNAIHTSVQTPAQATEYAVLVLSGFSGFTTGLNFGFSASNHLIAGAVADVPEPATYAMVGLALAGFGTLKFRRRKTLKKS